MLNLNANKPVTDYEYQEFLKFVQAYHVKRERKLWYRLYMRFICRNRKK